MADDSALEALLALQEVDATLDRLRHRRATLPERAELDASGAQAASIGRERAAVASERDALATREQALEDEMRTAETRAAEVERRMYSGTVSASRELSAMADDVAGLRARASDFEEQALEVLTEREPLDAQLADFDTRLAAIEAEMAHLHASLADGEAEVDRELAEVGARRGGLAAAVPEQLMPEYERLRARLGGVAVARLIGSRCDGCHLDLPATEVDRIRHQPAGAVVTCDNCGRILVRSS